MSLDVTLTKDGAEVYSANITHNLNMMAMMADVYAHIWRPEEHRIIKARELITPLAHAAMMMSHNHDYFQQFNPKDGFGSYDVLLKFIQEYRDACERFPDADVSICR